jgi:hypothetical protein
MVQVKIVLTTRKSKAPLSRKRLSILRYLSNIRDVFCAAFPIEVPYLRSFINKYPFLTLGIAFFFGLFFGGILRAKISQFVILSLLGGFAFAIPYGTRIGLPSFLSILLVIPIHAFTAYAAIRIIRAFEHYPKIEPYLTKFKDKYRLLRPSKPLQSPNSDFIISIVSCDAIFDCSPGSLYFLGLL